MGDLPEGYKQEKKHSAEEKKQLNPAGECRCKSESGG